MVLKAGYRRDDGYSMSCNGQTNRHAGSKPVAGLSVEKSLLNEDDRRLCPQVGLIHKWV